MTKRPNNYIVYEQPDNYKLYFAMILIMTERIYY